MSPICYFNKQPMNNVSGIVSTKAVLSMDYAGDICGAWNYKHTASLRMNIWLPWLPCDSESSVACINLQPTLPYSVQVPTPRVHLCTTAWHEHVPSFEALVCITYALVFSDVDCYQ